MFLSIPPLKVEIIPVTPLTQNCMILWNEKTAKGIVTDSGGNTSEILKKIRDLNIEIEAILLTHGHFDHVGGTMLLQEKLQNITQHSIPILGPAKQDAFLLSQVEQQTQDFGVLMEDVSNVIPERFLEDGERLVFDSLQLEVCHIPGHTPGHVVFTDLNTRLMITGDVLFRGSIGRSDFSYGDEEALIEGIKRKILSLEDDICILPGHGLGSTIGFERRHNPFLV